MELIIFLEQLFLDAPFNFSTIILASVELNLLNEVQKNRCQELRLPEPLKCVNPSFNSEVGIPFSVFKV